MLQLHYYDDDGSDDGRMEALFSNDRTCVVPLENSKVQNSNPIKVEEYRKVPKTHLYLIDARGRSLTAAERKLLGTYDQELLALVESLRFFKKYIGSGTEGVTQQFSSTISRFVKRWYPRSRLVNY